METRRKLVRLMFVIVVIPMAGLILWAFILQPLKYRYLIWRVESAQTATEEKDAFRLATRWGTIWEINHLRLEDAETDGKTNDDWLLQLEWLPTSPINGDAYIAYRLVTDTNNLRILRDEK